MTEVKYEDPKTLFKDTCTFNNSNYIPEELKPINNEYDSDEMKGNKLAFAARIKIHILNGSYIAQGNMVYSPEDIASWMLHELEEHQRKEA